MWDSQLWYERRDLDNCNWKWRKWSFSVSRWRTLLVAVCDSVILLRVYGWITSKSALTRWSRRVCRWQEYSSRQSWSDVCDIKQKLFGIYALLTCTYCIVFNDSNEVAVGFSMHKQNLLHVCIILISSIKVLVINECEPKEKFRLSNRGNGLEINRGIQTSPIKDHSKITRRNLRDFLFNWTNQFVIVIH